jgi:type IV pilus assembly protein PilC
MTQFSYLVRDAAGRNEAGTISATNLSEASRLLRAGGKIIVSVQAQRAAAVGGSKRMRRDDVIYVATQLAVMVDTGVPLPEALDAIAQQSDHPGVRAVVGDLSESVKGGATFSEALQKHSKIFSDVFIALMRASEASGTMGQMLQRVCEYMVQERDTRKRVQGAMVYPLAMLGFSVAVVVGLLVFVLPRFEKIYAGKNAMLPMPTQVLLNLSKFIVEGWPFILAVLAAVVAGAWWYLRTPAGKRMGDLARISLPLIGPMYRKSCLARSLRTMATMVTTGVNMLDGLLITAQSAGNYYYARIWSDLADRVREGSSLSSELLGCSLVPRTVAQMISAGERTGKLGTVMNRIAEFCEEDLKTAVKTVTTMIEPVMIIVMGCLIGGIAAALLLPIFTISRVMATPH